MKKFLKKAFCLVLAIVMVISIVPTMVFAEAVNKTPIIVIAGINSSELYLGDKRVWMPSASSTEGYEDLLGMLKGLTKFEDHGYNFDEYMRKIFVPTLQKYTEDSRCDGNGDSIKPLSIVATMNPWGQDPIARLKGGVISDVQEICADVAGPNRVFRFAYDLRLCVTEHTARLRQMIEHVKETTNSKKVRLIGVSMGGAVLNAYLNMYDHDDLESVIFLSSAAEGTNFPANIFSGKLNLTRDTAAASLKELIGVVPSALIGALETTFKDINSMWSGETLKYFYDNWIKDYIGHWPGLYNLIPSARLDECINFMLDPVKDKGMIQKLKVYQSYQDNLHNVLNKCKKDGVKVYVLSSYNINGLPFEGNDHQNDILIDTEYCTLGATAATFPEKTLGDNYKQKNDDGKERVSCDNIVDASTCWFPDQTWIIKNMVHCMFMKRTKDDKVDGTGTFFKWLISAKDEVSVESDDRWPQFLDYTKSKGTLVPLVKVEIETPGEEEGNGEFISSAVTTYSYTQITLLGWAVIAAIVLVIIILIVRSRKNKQNIDGVLTKEQIKALPKSERKAAKKQNKLRIKEYKKEQKAAKKARKAELKAMPKAERKAAKKADKALAKAAKKQAKIDRKAAKKLAKANKKAAKAAKKAGGAAVAAVATAAIAAEEATEAPAEKAAETPEQAPAEETAETPVEEETEVLEEKETEVLDENK